MELKDVKVGGSRMKAKDKDKYTVEFEGWCFVYMGQKPKDIISLHSVISWMEKNPVGKQLVRELYKEVGEADADK